MVWSGTVWHGIHDKVRYGMVNLVYYARYDMISSNVNVPLRDVGGLKSRGVSLLKSEELRVTIVLRGVHGIPKGWQLHRFQGEVIRGGPQKTDPNPCTMYKEDDI